MSAVTALSAGFLEFAAHAEANGLSNSRITIENSVGVLLFVTSVVSFVIVRNLAAARVSEVFLNNSVAFVRRLCISEFKLGRSYPNVDPVTPSRRRSADYFTIFTYFLISLLLLALSIALLTSQLEQSTRLLILASGVGGLVLFYVFTVERELGARRTPSKESKGDADTRDAA